MTEPTLKRFTVSLDAGDYDALCALAQAQRPPLSLQYTVRLAIRRFLDEYEGRAITLTPANAPANNTPAKRSKR
jgi:hypothetical protein